MTRHRHKAATWCAIAALAVALTGCGGEDNTHGGGQTTPTTQAAEPTKTTDPQEAEKAAVLAAYEGFTREEIKAYRKASMEGTRLKDFATLDALSEIELDLMQMQEAGTVVRGDIGHEAKVTALNLKAKVPEATIKDCVDLSKYQTYDTKAKRVIPLPSEQPLRYVAEVSAERWDRGNRYGWMITDYEPHGEQKC